MREFFHIPGIRKFTHVGGIKECKCMVFFWEFPCLLIVSALFGVGYLMIPRFLASFVSFGVETVFFWACQVGDQSQIPIFGWLRNAKGGIIRPTNALQKNAPQIPMQKAKLWPWNSCWSWICSWMPCWLSIGDSRVICGYCELILDHRSQRPIHSEIQVAFGIAEIHVLQKVIVLLLVLEDVIFAPLFAASNHTQLLHQVRVKGTKVSPTGAAPNPNYHRTSFGRWIQSDNTTF